MTQQPIGGGQGKKPSLRPARGEIACKRKISFTKATTENEKKTKKKEKKGYTETRPQFR